MFYKSIKKKLITEKIGSEVKYGEGIKSKGPTMQLARDVWGYDFSPDLAGIILGVRKPMKDLWHTVFGTQDANGDNKGDGLVWVQGFIGRGFNPLGKPVMGVPQALVRTTSNALTPSPVAGADTIQATFDHAYPGTTSAAGFFSGQQSIRESLESVDDLDNISNIDDSELVADERDSGYSDIESSRDDREDPVNSERDVGYETEEEEIRAGDEADEDPGSQLEEFPLLAGLASDAERWIKLKVQLLNAPTFIRSIEIWREFFGLKDTSVIDEISEMVSGLEEDEYDDVYLKSVIAEKILPEYATASWRLLLQTLKDRGELSDEAMAPAYSIYSKVREAM
jgi:hypothetical protein